MLKVVLSIAFYYTFCLRQIIFLYFYYCSLFEHEVFRGNEVDAWLATILDPIKYTCIFKHCMLNCVATFLNIENISIVFKTKRERKPLKVSGLSYKNLNFTNKILATKFTDALNQSDEGIPEEVQDARKISDCFCPNVFG